MFRNLRKSRCSRRHAQNFGLDLNRLFAERPPNPQQTLSEDSEEAEAKRPTRGLGEAPRGRKDLGAELHSDSIELKS